MASLTWGRVSDLFVTSKQPQVKFFKFLRFKTLKWLLTLTWTMWTKAIDQIWSRHTLTIYAWPMTSDDPQVLFEHFWDLTLKLTLTYPKCVKGYLCLCPFGDFTSKCELTWPNLNALRSWKWPIHDLETCMTPGSKAIHLSNFDNLQALKLWSRDILKLCMTSGQLVLNIFKNVKMAFWPCELTIKSYRCVPRKPFMYF